MGETTKQKIENDSQMAEIHELLESILQADNPAEQFQALVNAYSGEEDRKALIEQLNHCADFQAISIPNTIAGIMAGFLAGNPTEEEFYQSTLEAISSDIVFPSINMKAVALGAALVDPRLPYHRHTFLTVDEDEYATKLDELEEPIAEMRRIVFRRFAQKTQEASALLDVIEAHEDSRDRAILLGYLLASVRPPEPNYNS